MAIFSRIVRKSPVHSAIRSRSILAPVGQKQSVDLAPGILLTSLIDAFVILVIYMAVNLSNSSEMDLNHKGVQLPAVEQAQVLKTAPVLKILDGQYFLNDQQISEKELETRLASLPLDPADQGKSNPIRGIVIQADKDAGFSRINPVLIAGSKAGFNQFRFAVIRGETETK